MTAQVNSLLLEYACDTKEQFQEWLRQRCDTDLSRVDLDDASDTSDFVDPHPYLQFVVVPVVSVGVFGLAAVSSLTLQWLTATFSF
jgi:hypothetical protein